MELSPGRSVGSHRLGEALPGPPGFLVFALLDADEHELILPNAHLRLRAGAREAWIAGRTARLAAGNAAIPETGWVDVDGWPAWIRPRVQGPLDLTALDDAARADLAGWLIASNVNLSRAAAADLVIDGAGCIRYAALGLAEGQLPARTLAHALGPPGPAPAAAPRAPEPAAAPPRLPALLATGSLPSRHLPAALVIVELHPTNAAILARIASRTATGIREIERAAARPGRWIWAPVAAPERAPRLRLQAERAGFSAEVIATTPLSPTFLPALVAGGLAQVPLFVHSGIPALDTAIIAGLGLTAVVSMVRQGQRIAPARRAASAVGAWEAWRRAERTSGPERRLLALEERIGLEADAGAVRRDLADALDHAWTHLFAALDQEEPQRGRALRRLDDAAKRVATALNAPEEASAVQAITALRAAG